MPLVYADTSALYAFFHPLDVFAEPIAKAVSKSSVDFVYWRFLRYELRHNLRAARGDAHGEAAWNALRAAERTQARLRWQPELSADTILEAAEEISSQLAIKFDTGSADILHIASARRLHLSSGITAFWTCDAEQARAAKAAGLQVRLFQPK